MWLLPGSIPVLGQYGHSERAFGCDTHETAALVCRGEGHFVAVQAVSSILSQTKDIFEMQSEFSDLGQFFFHHKAKVSLPLKKVSSEDGRGLLRMGHQRPTTLPALLGKPFLGSPAKYPSGKAVRLSAFTKNCKKTPNDLFSMPFTHSLAGASLSQPH